MSKKKYYYIQNTGYCGNILKWWRVDGHGYTTDLKEAWKVNFEEAKKICRWRPKEDIMWDAELVERAATLQVCCEALRSEKLKISLAKAEADL